MSSDPSRDLADALALQVQEQQQRLVGLRGNNQDTEDVLVESLLEIDVAHEELRVAQGELRAQQAAIEELLNQQRNHGVWRERVSSLLTVPVFVTDQVGTVLETNSVATSLLGFTQEGLLRKPLTSLVAESGRMALRQALALMREHTEQQLIVELRSLNGELVQVTLAGFTDPSAHGDSRRYRWVAVPTNHDGPGPSPDRGDTSAAVFAKLCRLPINDETPPSLLARVATLGRDAVPHAAGVSVSLGPPTAPDSLASESQFAQAIDGVQIETGQGPCVDAYRIGRLVHSRNVSDDQRWPLFAPRAATAGLASSLALPLQAGAEIIGAVNLYSDTRDAFDAQDLQTAGLFAAAVSAVIQDVRERESLRKIGVQLQEALHSRAEIDQAKGILMARHGCSADEAFARLVTVSSNTNTKLRELAGRLVKATERSVPSPRAGSQDPSET